MATDVAEPSDAAKSHSTRRGILGRMHEFFNTKLGLAVLTFFLTSGLGAVASWIVADYQQARQAETLSLQARATELSSLHTGIIQSIIEREIAADNLIKAFDVGASAEEVSTLWKNYEDAVHTETLQAQQSHLVIMGHTVDGPDPTRIEGQAWVFWYYLTAAIQPRLNAMHDCLLDSHNAFISAAGPLPDRFAKARADLAGCRKDAHWDRFAYASPASGTANGPPVKQSISDWDDFKTCLEDYTFLLDESARLEARAGLAESSWPLSGLAWRKQGCGDDNASCQQDNFFLHLRDNLTKSCGNLDKDYL
jgi:hypothetical protein